VEDVCDRVAILYNGKVRAMGTINDLLEERSRYRITMPAELAPEVFETVLARVREAVGGEPDVDHPRRDLEQFFIEVVEKARQSATESSGTGPTKGVANYLSQSAPAHPDDVLKQLLDEKPPP
jgi:ABC-2 type transport system ATP-binding protein